MEALSLRLFSWLALILAVGLGLGSGPAAAQTPGTLVLDPAVGTHRLWPHVSVLVDPTGSWTPSQVIARLPDFRVLDGPPGNLGRRSGAVWLRALVQVPQGASGRWVLDIDYAPLDRIDVWLLDGPRIERQALLGDHVPWPERVLQTRAHALELELPAGAQRELLLRVQTSGTMIVPLRLRTPVAFLASEAREQALQGLMIGMGLCLLLYSLAQWVSLRDPMFGLYALNLLGGGCFFAAMSGVGPQHLWGASEWLTRNGAPFFILIGIASACFFVLRALEVHRFSPRVAQVAAAFGGLAGVAALLQLLGVIDYASAQIVGMALSPMPLVLVLPTSFRRIREGDRAAVYITAGWAVYSLGVLTMVGMLSGQLPIGFWTAHAFQFASMLEMAMWMLALNARVDEIRRGALRLQGERDELRSLLQTDHLTGLLNRRGLLEVAPALLDIRQPGQSVAVFLVDLDGFKGVNDRLGHEAGDALLASVAGRLREAMREQDLICRLGGDEFVLVAPGLVSEIDAARMGDKLVRALEQPFDIKGSVCRVGLTVGYALAPQDDTTLPGLLKRADAAMYGGKQSGRNCVRRGAAGAGLSGI